MVNLIFFLSLYCLLNFPTALPFIFGNATVDLAPWFLAQKCFLPTERVLSELQGFDFLWLAAEGFGHGSGPENELNWPTDITRL